MKVKKTRTCGKGSKEKYRGGKFCYLSRLIGTQRLMRQHVYRINLFNIHKDF